MLTALSALAANAAAGDTFYAKVSANSNYTMMFTDLGNGKAAVGNGYGTCIDYRYSGSLTIPATVTSTAGTTYTVTQVNKFAFYLCNLITTLTLPASLDRIDDFAFYGCRALVETNSRLTASATSPKVQSIGSGAFALTDIRTFWIENASECGSWSRGMFRGCDNMKWVVFGGTDSGKDFSKYYDRNNTDSRTDGLQKRVMVYMPKGVKWRKTYDASRTSLTPTDDDWAYANYVYYNDAGERESQFAAFGYNVSKLGISNSSSSSMDLPLDFTASLAYISRGASTADVQTIYVPMEVPMGMYNEDASYSASRAYAFDHYDQSKNEAVFRRVATLSANTGGLLVDFSNDVLANTNAHVSAFGPTTVSTPATDTMIGYYDHQVVPTGAWAYAGTGNTYDSGGTIKEGTLFKVSRETYSAPMRAILWLNTSSGAKGETIPAVFIDDDNTTTLIRGIADHEAADNLWYTLGGVRLTSKPTAKGIYVHGGKKVIVK